MTSGGRYVKRGVKNLKRVTDTNKVPDTNAVMNPNETVGAHKRWGLRRVA